MRVFSIVLAALASAAAAPVVATIIEPMQPDVWPGGRAVAVSVSPNNSSIAIVASESGGLFKTQDGGLTWTHLTGLPPFRMADVKYSPAFSQRVVATTYADTRTGNRGGIWRSLNGGINWEKVATSNPPAGPKCPAAASAYGISYVSGGIYVGTDCGLAISRDSGATWTHVVPDPAAANWRIVSVVAHGQGIIDVCGDAGIFRSMDGGGTWGAGSAGIGGCTQQGTHLIDVSPFNSDVLFVTTRPDKLFESVDGGRTWTSLNPPGASHLGRPSWLAVSKALPASPNQFEVAFGNPYNQVRQTCTNRSGSLNCNGSWAALTLDPPNFLETNGFSFNASGNVGRFIVGDGGVYGSTDGKTFKIGGGGAGGFNALQIYDVAGQILPDHTDLFFGTQDNCLWASPNDGRSWINPRCPEGYALQMKRRAPSHTGEIITGVAATWGNFKSSDHFATFDPWNNPPNNAGNPFIIDTGQYIQYTQATGAATGIALTLDTGGSWNPFRIPNSTTSFTIGPSPAHFPQIVGPPANPRIWQAVERSGGRTGLIRIDLDIANRSATSANADGSGSGSLGSLGRYSPGQGSFTTPAVFGADPADPQHVIATDVTSGRMKVTHDGGSTWTPMTALTDLILDGGRFQFSVPGGPLQVHTIGFNPDDTREVLVGTEAAGIFESADGGQTWAKVPFSDYFIRGISNFFFDHDRVIVSTYGNGLWKLLPGSFPPPTLCSSFPAPCRIDIRTIVGERIYPRWACPHPPDLPTCQVYGLDRGVIEDITLTNEGALKALAVNEGKLEAWDIDGERIDPSLPVKPTTATRPGEFSGCPGCLGILAEGGSITGFIYAEDRVTAVIGRFQDEPVGGKMALAAAGSREKEEAPPAGPLPYLQLVGTVKITGQPTAMTGDTVQVYGSGFCAAPGCSSVTLRIGDRVVAKGVKVDGKGSFQTAVKVTETRGHHGVSATQKTGKGEELRDERMLVVVAPEEEGDRER